MAHEITFKRNQKVTLADVPHGHDSLIVAGATFVVEGYWDEIEGNKSWKESDGNPAAMIYALRIAYARLPVDDEVLYGKIAGLGCLVHVTEIEGYTEEEQGEKS